MIMKFYKNIKFVDGFLWQDSIEHLHYARTIPGLRICASIKQTKLPSYGAYGAYGLMEKVDNKQTNGIISDSDKSYNENHVQ